ncbi:DEAD/DEAH box helicase [bacterium]|nr:DEAD/DEAH box helicase [bacterium]
MKNITSFSDLGLSKKLIQAIEGLGYVKPTEIQEKAIPMLLQDSQKDFIGQAQTGTGKTAAFMLPILQKINIKNQHVQALVLAPTRELAQQVEKETVKFAKHLNVKTCCVYGGSPYKKQIQTLKKEKPSIVVGTPGRIKDLINRGVLVLDNASHCVLDEADEMLNMGFFDDIEEILQQFNEQRQLVMFSATMPKGILKLIDKTFKAYERVNVEKKQEDYNNIKQQAFICEQKYFLDALLRILIQLDEVYGIVFCNKKIETRDVGEKLKTFGYKVDILNGDQSQEERQRSMQSFKRKKQGLLVCTDVAARGIDINSISHVFNYGLPQDAEIYTHRIGRTGRAGQTGIAYTIVDFRDTRQFKRIEKMTKNKIELKDIPNTELLKQEYFKKTLQNIETYLKDSQTNPFIDENKKLFSNFQQLFSNFKSEDLIALMFQQSFQYKFAEFEELKNMQTLTFAQEKPKRSYNRKSKFKRGPKSSKFNKKPLRKRKR